MRNNVTLNLPILTIVMFFLQGCAETPSYPSTSSMTAGIFLDPGPATRSLNVRKISDKGIELTKLSEGFESELYNDAADYCTIGYGHLVKLAPCDGTESEEFLAGLSVAQGTDLLRDDMGMAENAVSRLTTVPLTDGQYAALCDFVFNVGSGNYASSTLRKVINAGDYDAAAFQFSRWTKAGGRELRGLVIRREREIDLFYDGIERTRMLPRADEDLSLIDIRVGEAANSN